MRLVAADDEYWCVLFPEPRLVARPVDQGPAVDGGVDTVTADLADDLCRESGAKQGRLLIDFGELVILTVNRLKAAPVVTVKVEIHVPPNGGDRDSHRKPQTGPDPLEDGGDVV